MWSKNRSSSCYLITVNIRLIMMSDIDLSLRSDESFHQDLLRPWSLAMTEYSERENQNEADDHKYSRVVEESDNKSRCKVVTFWNRCDNKKPPSQSILGHHRMLFDRSLRLMAALMTLYAVVMMVICITKLKPFVHRSNRGTTSVGLNEGRRCQDLKRAELVSSSSRT